MRPVPLIVRPRICRGRLGWLGRLARRAPALYSTGEADPKRLYRELQRQVPRRIFKRALVSDFIRSAIGDCSVAPGILKRGADTQHHWGCDTPGVHSELSNRGPADAGAHFLSRGVINGGRSPRNTRSTTSIFLREENLPRSAFDFALVTSIHQGAVCPAGVSKKIVRRKTIDGEDLTSVAFTRVGNYKILILRFRLALLFPVL